MRKDQVIKLVTGVVLLGAAAVLLAQWYGDGEDLTAVANSHYICGKCKNEFGLSPSEHEKLAQHADPVRCPKCSSDETNWSVQCPFCKRLMPPVGHSGMPSKCPHCKADLTRLPPRTP